VVRGRPGAPPRRLPAALPGRCLLESGSRLASRLASRLTAGTPRYTAPRRYTLIKYNQKRMMKKASLASASVEPLSALAHSDSARDLAAALLQHGRSLDGSLDGGSGRISQLARKLSDVPGSGPGSQAGGVVVVVGGGGGI
jgi:hypothetical protein